MMLGICLKQKDKGMNTLPYKVILILRYVRWNDKPIVTRTDNSHTRRYGGTLCWDS